MSKIPTQRKALYYIGMGLIILGVILFLSVFFTVARTIGSFMSGGFMMDPFSSIGRVIPSFGNAIFGFILIIIGAILMTVGARGAAGSGIILDPERAREDLKPYSEAAGGMINDAISQIDVVDKLTTPQEDKEVIKIKCRNCKSLNDEDAKFCKNCGMEL